MAMICEYENCNSRERGYCPHCDKCLCTKHLNRKDQLHDDVSFHNPNNKK